MTEIYFSFDTEDFTSDYAANAIRDEAEILREYGIKGNFNIVGYLARELVRNRRMDVLDALKHHTISYHSLAHSLHPTICEYTDKDNYQEAREELVRKEYEGAGMVRAATGVEHLVGACPPGESLSYVAMYEYAEMGIPLYLGSLFYTPDGAGVYYCNGFHTNYDVILEQILVEQPVEDLKAFVDSLAGMKRVILYNHPNKVLFEEFWDEVNYRFGNLSEMYQWKEPPRRTADKVAMYYKGFRKLIEILLADDRFVIKSMDDLEAYAVDKAENRVVTKDMLPAIRENLQKHFTWMQSPVSLSVADCFFAAKHFMASDEPYKPGKAHGFLYSPKGTQTPCSLTEAEIKALAEQCAPESFLPECFQAGEKIIGPADLLFAMLDVAMGAKESQIEPKEQQCDYSALPRLRSMNMRDSWIHSKDFEDKYLSDRLRLQAWTIRTEE